MPAPSLADIAGALDPQRDALPADMVGRLSISFGSQWTGSLVGRLGAIAARLAAEDVTVTFGGHFSCGKSTLINALIGRSLLPTSDYPETGVPCRIAGGSQDRAVAVTRDGEVDLSFDADAIARMVSLIDGDGDDNRRVDGILRLEVTLAGAAVPAGLIFVDSPGINDAEVMTARAGALAGDADILVWVFNSQQPVSQSEQAFLLRHLDRRSRGGVVFIVNAFLPADTAESWSWFLTERAPRLRDRLDAALELRDGHGAERPEVLFVSARAAGGDPAGFGAPAVRELITGLTLHSPRIQATRLGRAETDLRAVLTELDERMRDERAHVERDRATLLKRQQDAGRQRQQFERTLARDVAAAFARHRAMAQGRANEVAAEIGTQPLQPDGAYGALLASKLREVTDQLASEVLAETSRNAGRIGLTSPSGAVAQQVRELLAPTEVEIGVPGTRIAANRKGLLGAAVGGVLGNFVAPVAGAYVGAILGSAVGGGIGQRRAAAAMARDRAAAQADALTAGEAAVATLMSHQEAVERLLLADCRLPQPPQAAPDETRLQQLVSLHNRLLGQQLWQLSRAASIARQEVGR